MTEWLLNPEVRGLLGSGQEARLLAAYAQVWERKAILRQLYGTWYRWIAGELGPGNIVEIGAGTGNFKRWLLPRPCWTLDILPGQQVNLRADALCLPVRAGCLDNLVLIDALHHFARPFAFLAEAARALRPGGRLVLVEPFVSLWGWFVYRYLHHERVDFRFRESAGAKDAWDGNAAIPQLVLATQNRGRLPLRVAHVHYGEFLAYPLSGGFSYRALLPEGLLLGWHQLERARLFRNRALSLRVFAVLEKAR